MNHIAACLLEVWRAATQLVFVLRCGQLYLFLVQQFAAIYQMHVQDCSLPKFPHHCAPLPRQYIFERHCWCPLATYSYRCCDLCFGLAIYKQRKWGFLFSATLARMGPARLPATACWPASPASLGSHEEMWPSSEATESAVLKRTGFQVAWPAPLWRCATHGTSGAPLALSQCGPAPALDCRKTAANEVCKQEAGLSA